MEIILLPKAFAYHVEYIAKCSDAVKVTVGAVVSLLVFCT